MDYFAQQLINGLVLGSIYGLIAIGYTMVYGIVGMINFAHGDIFMIGGFIALITFLILVSLGLTFVPVILLLVLLVSMAVTALYGWTVERIAYRPLRHSFRLAPMLSAIGMSFVLSNYSQVAQGARVKPVPPIITGGYTLHEGVGGFAVQLSNIQIVVVLTTVALLAIFTWLVSRTRLGRDMRACEQDQTMAALLGVDVDRTISMTFVIGAALAAVAGLMYLLYYGLVDFFMGFVAGIKAFTAAVLGGIGSLPGAMLGGLATIGRPSRKRCKRRKKSRRRRPSLRHLGLHWRNLLLEMPDRAEFFVAPLQAFLRQHFDHFVEMLDQVLFQNRSSFICIIMRPAEWFRDNFIHQLQFQKILRGNL